jgi:hypothetical protein
MLFLIIFYNYVSYYFGSTKQTEILIWLNRLYLHKPNKSLISPYLNRLEPNRPFAHL